MVAVLLLEEGGSAAGAGGGPTFELVKFNGGGGEGTEPNVAVTEAGDPGAVEDELLGVDPCSGVAPTFVFNASGPPATGGSDAGVVLFVVEKEELPVCCC